MPTNPLPPSISIHNNSQKQQTHKIKTDNKMSSRPSKSQQQLCPDVLEVKKEEVLFCLFSF